MKNARQLRALIDRVWGHYEKAGRVFPWRPPELALRRNGVVQNPYQVLVSEVMLQQTQAGVRTILKYQEFLRAFPTTAELSCATLSEVYALWQGLGYNRRAKALRDSAILIEKQLGGRFPRTCEELRELPGVGPYTAAAVYVFSYNKPAVLIETNIRSVFIHHLFKGEERISDAQLLPYIERALDATRPRDWYYALMDYGAVLKREEGNASRKSRHYVRQSTFKGSNRELRGKLLRELLEHPGQVVTSLARRLKEPSQRVSLILTLLCNESLLRKERGRYSLA